MKLSSKSRRNTLSGKVERRSVMPIILFLTVTLSYFHSPRLFSRYLLYSCIMRVSAAYCPGVQILRNSLLSLAKIVGGNIIHKYKLLLCTVVASYNRILFMSQRS